MDLLELRKEIGGKVEAALNKMIDEKVGNLGKDFIKAQLHAQVDKLVDENYDKLIGDVLHKLKADIIDAIDGEDDVQ